MNQLDIVEVAVAGLVLAAVVVVDGSLILWWKQLPKIRSRTSRDSPAVHLLLRVEIAFWLTVLATLAGIFTFNAAQLYLHRNDGGDFGDIEDSLYPIIERIDPDRSYYSNVRAL